MRLFGIVDGAVDEYDRAAWLTGIFDLAFAAPSQSTPGQAYVVATGAYVAGSAFADSYVAGSSASGLYVAGSNQGTST